MNNVYMYMLIGFIFLVILSPHIVTIVDYLLDKIEKKIHDYKKKKVKNFRVHGTTYK